MTTKEEILVWAEGVKAYRDGDWANALEAFQQVGDFSRIHFNSGMIYTQLDDYAAATTCYTNSLGADPYLAVAYFQRAYCAFMMEDYQEAEMDYTRTLRLLRENDHIDYTQLGLKYRLYRCEVHFNRAMCAHSLGDSVSCTQDITYGQRVCRTDEQRAIIERAARAGVETVTLFTVPVDAVFDVLESKLRNAGERTYLKDAKVVMENGAGGGWAGFGGAAIMDPTAGLEKGSGTVVRRAGSDPAAKTMGRPRRGTDPSAGVRPTLSRSGSGQRRSDPDSLEPFQRTLMRRSDENATIRPSPVEAFNDPIAYGGSPANYEHAVPIRANTSAIPPRISSTQPRQNSRTGSDYQKGSLQTVGRSYGNSSNSNIASSSRNVDRNNDRNNDNFDPYPSPTPSQLSPAGNGPSFASSSASGKTKIKIHTVAPLVSRCILLLVPSDFLSHSFILARCREKLGIRNPVLEFSDPSEDDPEMISIADDDDLSTAVEVMNGKWEFSVRDD